MKKKLLLIILITLIILSLFAFLIYNGYLWFVYPDTEKYSVIGIDISHYQRQINWDDLKNNKLTFCFIKATEGDDYIDNKFNDYKKESKNIGLKIGAYHFYSLRISGDKQAINFINIVDINDIDLPPVIDLEFGGNTKYRPFIKDFENEINQFVNCIVTKYKSPPIIYTTYEFYDVYLSKIKINSNYYLWIRNIFFEPGKIKNKDWTFWQYKNRGRIKGINGFVDLNVYKSTLEDFKTILIK